MKLYKKENNLIKPNFYISNQAVSMINKNHFLKKSQLILQ